MVWIHREISQEFRVAGGGCERCGRRVPLLGAGDLVRRGWRVDEAGMARCQFCVRGDMPQGSEVLEIACIDN